MLELVQHWHVRRSVASHRCMHTTSSTTHQWLLDCSLSPSTSQQLFIILLHCTMDTGKLPTWFLYATVLTQLAELSCYRRLSVRLSNACNVTKRKHLVKKVQLWLIGSRLRAFQWAEDEQRILPLNPQFGYCGNSDSPDDAALRTCTPRTHTTIMCLTLHLLSDCLSVTLAIHA